MRKLLLVGLTALTSALAGLALSVATTTSAHATAAHSTKTIGSSQILTEHVSCSFAAACLGFGFDIPAKGPVSYVPLAWNGKTWRRLTLPAPAKGATQISLTGVSCASTSKKPFCLTVGEYVPAGKPGDVFAFALAWTGSGLQLLPAPSMPAGTDHQFLAAVSCLPTKECVAVGNSYGLNAQGVGMLFDTWDGTGWTDQINGAYAHLDDLSCTTVQDCVLAGTFSQLWNGKQFPHSARWNGTSVKRLTVPAPAGSVAPVLLAVSCPSALTCVATGLDESKTNGNSFVDYLSGTTWTLGQSPWGKGTKAGRLFGLSCWSATGCSAVGSTGSDTAGRAAALILNGRSWTAQHIPAPAKGRVDRFGGVSCATKKACVALGDIGPAKSGQRGPLGAYLNGAAWSLKPA